MKQESVRAAVIALLNSPTPSSLGITCYDYVPTGTELPYSKVGEVTIQDDDTDDSVGAVFSVPVHTFYTYKGGKTPANKMDAIYARLHRTEALTISGATVVTVYVEKQELLPMEEGGTVREGVTHLVIKLDDMTP